jgi:hypothetical protein
MATTAKFVKGLGTVAIVFVWMSLSSHCADPLNPVYHLARADILNQLDTQQIGLVEKLNRTDRAHMSRAATPVVPGCWLSDEHRYNHLPASPAGGCLGADAFQDRRSWLDLESRPTPIALTRAPQWPFAANGG